MEINTNITAEDMQAEAKRFLNKHKEELERKNNRFPVEVFPLAVQQIINATNENLNFPIDFIAILKIDF